MASMAMSLITPPNHRRERKPVKRIAKVDPEIDLQTPLRKTTIFAPSRSAFKTVKRHSSNLTRKQLARVARYVSGPAAVKAFLAARERHNAIADRFRARNARNRLLAAQQTVSPSSRRFLPRESTPEGDLGDHQDNIDLLNSPSAVRLAKATGGSSNDVLKLDALVFGVANKPFTLTEILREHSKVFLLKSVPANQDLRVTRAVRLTMSFGKLAKNSSTCRALLHQKRIGKLDDSNDTAVFDPAGKKNFGGKRQGKAAKLKNCCIYIKGLLASDFAKRQDSYKEVKAMKLATFWAALTTFVKWVGTGRIFLGEKEGDHQAAYFVASFLGAPDQYFTELDF